MILYTMAGIYNHKNIIYFFLKQQYIRDEKFKIYLFYLFVIWDLVH